MSAKKSSISDYPEHLNPFYEGPEKLHFWGKLKRRSSLSGSLKDLRNTITFRSFRGQKKSKHREDDDVQLRNKTVGYGTVSRQTLPVYRRPEIQTSTPLLPRSRFSERVRKSNNETHDSTYDSSKNPFENEENDEVSSPQTKLEENRKKVRRRKRRAPLPPGMKDSSWSLTSVETDASSYAYSDVSELDVSELEKPSEEIYEEFQSFTKEMKKMTDSTINEGKQESLVNGSVSLSLNENTEEDQSKESDTRNTDSTSSEPERNNEISSKHLVKPQVIITEVDERKEEQEQTHQKEENVQNKHENEDSYISREIVLSVESEDGKVVEENVLVIESVSYIHQGPSSITESEINLQVEKEKIQEERIPSEVCVIEDFSKSNKEYITENEEQSSLHEDNATNVFLKLNKVKLVDSEEQSNDCKDIAINEEIAANIQAQEEKTNNIEGQQTHTETVPIKEEIKHVQFDVIPTGENNHNTPKSEAEEAQNHENERVHTEVVPIKVESNHVRVNINATLTEEKENTSFNHSCPESQSEEIHNYENKYEYVHVEVVPIKVGTKQVYVDVIPVEDVQSTHFNLEEQHMRYIDAPREDEDERDMNSVEEIISAADNYNRNVTERVEAKPEVSLEANNNEYVLNGSFKNSYVVDGNRENKFPVEEVVDNSTNSSMGKIEEKTIENKIETQEKPPVPKIRKKKFTKSKLLGFFSK